MTTLEKKQIAPPEDKSLYIDDDIKDTKVQTASILPLVQYYCEITTDTDKKKGICVTAIKHNQPITTLITDKPKVVEEILGPFSNVSDCKVACDKRTVELENIHYETGVFP